ncbi:hypothetical protein J1614_000294 [Plenodomus biglobosus]|nr:hypothetical protein J1614_000294 [Plenodomus biglobosus]
MSPVKYYAVGVDVFRTSTYLALMQAVIATSVSPSDHGQYIRFIYQGINAFETTNSSDTRPQS